MESLLVGNRKRQEKTADCGAKLYFYTCKIHFIRKQVLYRIVLETIRRTLAYVRMFRKDFKLEMLAQDEKSLKNNWKKRKKHLLELKNGWENSIKSYSIFTRIMYLENCLTANI